ncbi:helix-hairpin-helix domain-containing protein [Clostridium nigeriense]|uniref:helix-hairpin-helix domain-containing protein n=1 Tax=Clostridium nigeriense TaxID=1805470 RepID=UPI003D337DFA
MDKKIKDLLNVRNIVLVILALFCILASFYLYGINKSSVFKDEYMKNIFVEENDINSEEGDGGSTETFGENIVNNTLSKITVEIKGEVKNPDVYEIDEGSIIRDLINMAGGLTEEANIDGINRAEKLRANELIVIPNNDNANNNVGDSSISTGVSSDGIININTATLTELQNITGIGEVKAQSIISYREKNGGFKSIEEIKNVDGIGAKTFEKIKDQISI